MDPSDGPPGTDAPGTEEASADAPTDTLLAVDGPAGDAVAPVLDAASDVRADKDRSDAVGDAGKSEAATDAGSGDARQADARPDVVNAPCTETEGIINPSNGHCYFLTPKSDVWTLIRDECVRLASHLVTTESNAEVAFITSWLPTNGGRPGDRWIGLYQVGSGPFQWVTGEAVVSTNWAAGEPNDGPGACGRMQPDGTWADWALCDGSFRGICERDP